MRNHSTGRGAPSLPDEARLIDLARSGNAAAFAQLYDAYVERVSRYVYLRIADDREVEDLVAQVFLKAWENLDRYKVGKSPFPAWLYTIARNLVIDHYRTKKDALPLDEALAVPADVEMLDEQVQTHFDLEELRNALQHLTADQQHALVLKYIGGLSNESIAKIMNKQEGTVRGLQMRGLQALAKHMQEKEAV